MTTGLQFDAESHVYRLDGREIPSVTQMLGALKPPFDAPAAAARVAAREGRDPDAILGEWDAKREAACDLGHRTHAAIEDYLSDRFVATPTAEYRQFVKWWHKASLSLSPVDLELRMASEELWVAGTMDATFASSKTGKIHVFDWKTNGRFETASRYGDRLLDPFGDLASCELSIYSLQLSIYRLMREMMTGVECGDSYLLHLTPDAATPYRCVDYRDRVEAWLKQERPARL